MTQNFISQKYKDILTNNVNENFVIDISKNDAYEIRETCEDEMPSGAFDQNYNPTEKGIFLENLIGKFYIG
jgi:hypothetical protein